MLQSKDDSVTNDLLILTSQKFEENQGLYLGNDDKNNKTNEIPYKKQNQTIAVQLMSRFFLHHKKSEENHGIWGMTTRMIKSMKLCVNTICICMLLS